MEERITWDDLEPFMVEVRAMARDLLRREWQAESLQTGALVQTALRRQRGAKQDWSAVTWQNRHYFFGAVRKAMRRALIDHGRKRKTKQRTAVVHLEDLQVHDLPHAVKEAPEQAVALGEAIDQLEQEHPEWAEVFELRVCVGLTIPAIAKTKGVSINTVKRMLEKARLLLHEEILRRLNEE